MAMDFCLMHLNFILRPEFIVSKYTTDCQQTVQHSYIIFNIYLSRQTLSQFPWVWIKTKFLIFIPTNNLYLNFTKFSLHESNKTYPPESVIKTLHLLNLLFKKDNEKNISHILIYYQRRKCMYALVIAQFRVQYCQYFPSFLYFANLFHEPLGKWNKSKIWQMRKILAILCKINVQ